MRPRGQSDSSVFGSRIQPAPICVETGERQVGVLDFARIPVRKIGMRRWMWVLKRLDSHHPQWADYRHFGKYGLRSPHWADQTVGKVVSGMGSFITMTS